MSFLNRTVNLHLKLTNIFMFGHAAAGSFCGKLGIQSVSIDLSIETLIWIGLLDVDSSHVLEMPHCGILASGLIFS